MIQVHSSLLKELIDSDAINYYKGEFLIWDMPVIVFPINSVILMNHLKEKFPEMTMDELLYNMGWMQSHRGNRVLMQRFGLEPNEKLMRDAFGKSEMLGIGAFEFIDLDPETKTFTVLNYHSPYAHQYLKMMGFQNKEVCHFLRGLCAGSFQAFFKDEEMFCVELKCVAMGERACVFRIKPLNRWDLDDPVVKRQLIKHKIPDKVFEELYTWDNLVSRNAGRPKTDEEIDADRVRMDGLIEVFRRDRDLD